MARFKKASGSSSRGAGGDAWFAPMNLQPVDEARAVERPPKIRFYSEDQYDAYSLEQVRLWQAEGTRKTEPWRQIAAETEAEAKEVLREIEKQWDRVKAASDREQELAGALAGYARRGRFEKTRYYLTTGALLFGDVAGVGGAAIYLGEEPGLAVCQAVASGVAAVTAGLVGQEVKDSRRARRRAVNPESVRPELAKFAHLLRGADTGESIVKAMTLGALSVAGVIAVSIFALRSSTEGITAGFVFGGLAAAISLASFINTFTYADDIADLLDNADYKHRRESKRHVTLTQNRGLCKHRRAIAAIDSIGAEYALRGQAAERSATAEKNNELSKHPGVAGHGYASDIKQTPENGPDVERTSEWSDVKTLPSTINSDRSQNGKA